MIYKIFAIYDEKADAFMLPFFSPTTEVAQRHFARGVTDPASTIAHFPADYTLYEIGSIDDSTALITPLAPAVNLGSGISFISNGGKNGQR